MSQLWVPPLPPSECHWPLFLFPHMKAKELMNQSSRQNSQKKERGKKREKHQHGDGRQWAAAMKNVRFSVEKAQKEEGGVLAQLSSFFSMESAASSKNHVLSSFAAVFHVSIEWEKKRGGDFCISSKWQQGCWPAGLLGFNLYKSATSRPCKVQELGSLLSFYWAGFASSVLKRRPTGV